MWLMVGYVYFLTPLEPIVSKRQELQAGSEGMPAAAIQHLEMTDSVGGMSLTVELEKSRFQPSEAVVVMAHISGVGDDREHSELASLLIENGTQVVGPVLFTRRPGSQGYVGRVMGNPMTGLPLAPGSYQVVVRVGADLVAAVTFEVAASGVQVAFQH